tara:strand:- start:109 stop:525 length:417 start_codon:yes stop_codon:yes gene_type:complete
LNSLNVVVGIISRDKTLHKTSEIVIAKRAKKSVRGNLWEFPGGKVETNETSFDALKRELKEELNINVSVAREVKNFHHQYTDLSIYFSVWHVTEFRGNPIGNEGQSVVWSSCGELSQYSFPAANSVILEWIIQNICIK